MGHLDPAGQTVHELAPAEEYDPLGQAIMVATLVIAMKEYNVNKNPNDIIKTLRNCRKNVL